jgi:branched-chain amino acid transport system substrate-binding protein
MRMRGMIVVAAVGALLLTAACGSSTGTARASSGSPVTFGAPIELSGALAAEGAYTLHGYQYCVHVVNAKGGVTYGGQKHILKLVYQDDQSVPANAATVVDQLNDQGIKLLLGPYGSPDQAAASPEVEKNGDVMVDSNGADITIFHQGYKDTFAVLAPSTDYLVSMVDWLATLSPRPSTVAIISADDGFSQTAAAAGAKEAQAKGMTVVPSLDAYSSSTKVPANTTDVHTALEAIAPYHPDVILVSGHFNEAVAAIKQGKQLGIEPKLGFGATVAVPSSDWTALGTLAEGTFGSTQWVPEVEGSDRFFGTAEQFAKGYTSEFKDVVGGIPAYQAAEAAAACEVLVDGVEKANSVDPTKVRNAIAGLNIDTFYGRIKFYGPSGVNPGMNEDHTMQVIQVQGEPADPKLVTVYPTSFATSGHAIWPAPLS